MDAMLPLAPTRADTTTANTPTKGASPELAEAARDFESLILGIMVKSMRSTIEKGDIFGDTKHIETYEQLLDQEYAKGIAKQGGMGFADMIMRQYGQSADGAADLRAATAGLRASQGGYEAYGDAAAASTIPRTGGE